MFSFHRIQKSNFLLEGYICFSAICKNRLILKQDFKLQNHYRKKYKTKSNFASCYNTQNQISGSDAVYQKFNKSLTTSVEGKEQHRTSKTKSPNNKPTYIYIYISNIHKPHIMKQICKSATQIILQNF